MFQQHNLPRDLDLSKLILLTYNIKNSKNITGSKMKTRTKQKVEEEIVANKHKEMEITGDFFLEDFGKVKNLLRSWRKLSRTSESDKPSSDHRSSTEAERKHAKPKADRSYRGEANRSNEGKPDSHPSHQIIDISSNESDYSENKHVQGSDKQNDDTAEKYWPGDASKFNTKRKRDIKNLNKIEEGFKYFYNLIKDLNANPPAPRLPHFSDDFLTRFKNECIDTNKELVDENSIQSVELNQELENIIEQNNPLEIPDEVANSNNFSKTSADSHESEQQSSLIAQEISIEYIQERMGSSHQNHYESITLVPECYQSQMRIASWSKCPLITNQSIHCQIAYYITDILKRKYFNQQYKLFLERERLRNSQSTHEGQTQQSWQANK